VTKELTKWFDAPVILCNVAGQKLQAKATYNAKRRHLIGIEFWFQGKWIHQWDLKFPRPMTLVAVPKFSGQENVPFYLLTKKDIAAPQVGGEIHREGMIEKRAILSKDLKRLIELKQPQWYLEYLRGGRKPARDKAGEVKFGRPKRAEKITLSDYQKHPIWVSAHDEHYDEEWYKPVVKPSEVTKGVLKENHPVLLFKLAGIEEYGCGYYDHKKGEIYGISVFTGGKWKIIEDAAEIRTPARLAVLPNILGKEQVEFLLRDRKSGRAKRKS
jgi:hypothetical protein